MTRHVTIVGAGVVGATTAWEAASRGWQVTLLDALPSPAEGTSFANGGQLSYSHVEPWACPAALPGVAKALLFPRYAPVAWRFSWNMEEWRWLYAFLRQTFSARRTQQQQEKLEYLARLSQQRMAALLQTVPLKIDYAPMGSLHLYARARHFRAAHGQFAVARWLDSEEIPEFEPFLATARYAGAAHATADAVGDAHRFSRQLIDWLCEKKLIAYRPLTDVARVAPQADGFKHLVLADGEVIQSKYTVLATGHSSQRLLAPLGVRTGIVPLAGYSLTLECDDSWPLPAHALIDHHARIVASRLGTRLRVAGMGDLGQVSPRQMERRFVQLARWTRKAGVPEDALAQARYWHGYRPAHPTGVPRITETQIPGLYCNMGHGSLGWTLAAGSASYLLDMMENRINDPALRQRYAIMER
jgi:D-amino-acid dehydrogenase